MPQPQAGIIPEPSPNALFLILRVREPAIHGPTVAKVAAGAPSLANKIGTIEPRAKLVGTVSFGAEFWDVISPNKRPVGLRPFKAIEVSGRSAPNTFCSLTRSSQVTRVTVLLTS
jgi:putative iron-dependent peroxidase